MHRLRREDPAALKACAELIGLDITRERVHGSPGGEASDATGLGADVLDRIALRLERLKAKDFTEADRIRAELAEEGVLLKDGKDPETGERVTSWERKS